MPDGHFDPLPIDQGDDGLVRHGRFIDVEVLGTIVAQGGTYDSITITNATIDVATIDDATITNADITSGSIGGLTIDGDLTMTTGAAIAFASSTPRLIIDYDSYGSQDIVFESGHQYEYSKGKWNFTTADSAPFIYATLALTGTYLGDATNRGAGNINVTSDYQNSEGEVDINSQAYGNWDAVTEIGAIAVGSGDATTTVNATANSGTGVLSLRSSGEVNFYAGGAERLVLDSAGQLEAIDGTQSAPAYSFSNDPDSGIYNLGSNDVGIVAGGTRRLRVNGTRIDCDNVSFLSHPVKSTTGDPSGPQNGDVYVNTSDNKMRVYADGAWRDIVTW